MSISRNMLSFDFVHVPARGIGMCIIFEDDIGKGRFRELLFRWRTPWIGQPSLKA